MKKTLEAVLVVAALALCVFLAVHWKRSMDLASRPAVNPASRPGTDREEPSVTPPGVPKPGGVSVLPMVKLSRPPRPPRQTSAVPAPGS